MVFHQGFCHAGQASPDVTDRWLHKIRLNPRVPQVRLWRYLSGDERFDVDSYHTHIEARGRVNGARQG